MPKSIQIKFSHFIVGIALLLLLQVFEIAFLTTPRKIVTSDDGTGYHLRVREMIVEDPDGFGLIRIGTNKIVYHDPEDREKSGYAPTIEFVEKNEIGTRIRLTNEPKEGPQMMFYRKDTDSSLVFNARPDGSYMITMLKLIADPAFCFRVIFQPDSKKIVFHDAKGNEIIELNLNGSETEPLIKLKSKLPNPIAIEKP